VYWVGSLKSNSVPPAQRFTQSAAIDAKTTPLNERFVEKEIA